MTNERMSDIEIKMHLQKLGMIAQIALTIPTAELLHEFSMNDTLGPLLDPTGWMAIRENSSKNERAVRALADFQSAMRKAWPEMDALLEREAST